MAEQNGKQGDRRQIKEGALSPSQDPPSPPPVATVVDPGTGKPIEQPSGDSVRLVAGAGAKPQSAGD